MLDTYFVVFLQNSPMGTEHHRGMIHLFFRMLQSYGAQSGGQDTVPAHHKRLTEGSAFSFYTHAWFPAKNRRILVRL